MQDDDARKFLSAERRSLITTPEAAKYLGLKKTTLEAWRCRGGGPRYIALGRAIRYRPTDLEDWIESRTRNNSIGGEE